MGFKEGDGTVSGLNTFKDDFWGEKIIELTWEAQDLTWFDFQGQTEKNCHQSVAERGLNERNCNFLFLRKYQIKYQSESGSVKWDMNTCDLIICAQKVGHKTTVILCKYRWQSVEQSTSLCIDHAMKTPHECELGKLHCIRFHFQAAVSILQEIFRFDERDLWFLHLLSTLITTTRII